VVQIYKKGQGVTVRWVAVAALGALAVFGCYGLEDFVRGYTADAGLSLGFATVQWSVLVSVCAFLGAVALIAFIVNHKRLVDYLISSETELRKVSWPTRAELKRQTVVVLVTIVIFSLVLLVADLLFAYGSGLLYGLHG